MPIIPTIPKQEWNWVKYNSIFQGQLRGLWRNYNVILLFSDTSLSFFKDILNKKLIKPNIPLL